MMTLVFPVVYHFEVLDEWGGCFLLTLQTAEDSERGGAGVGLPPGGLENPAQ